MPDPDQTADALEDLDPGQTLSVPVVHDGDTLRVDTDDERLLLPGLDPSELPREFGPDEPHLLVGDLSTYARGVGVERSYLFLESVEEVVAVEDQERATTAATPFAGPKTAREAEVHQEG